MLCTVLITGKGRSSKLKCFSESTLLETKHAEALATQIFFLVAFVQERTLTSADSSSKNF
jgi:hypothetical protein